MGEAYRDYTCAKCAGVIRGRIVRGYSVQEQGDQYERDGLCRYHEQCYLLSTLDERKAHKREEARIRRIYAGTW